MAQNTNVTNSKMIVSNFANNIRKAYNGTISEYYVNVENGPSLDGIGYLYQQYDPLPISHFREDVPPYEKKYIDLYTAAKYPLQLNNIKIAMDIEVSIGVEITDTEILPFHSVVAKIESDDQLHPDIVSQIATKLFKMHNEDISIPDIHSINSINLSYMFERSDRILTISDLMNIYNTKDTISIHEYYGGQYVKLLRNLSGTFIISDKIMKISNEISKNSICADAELLISDNICHVYLLDNVKLSIDSPYFDIRIHSNTGKIVSVGNKQQLFQLYNDTIYKSNGIMILSDGIKYIWKIDSLYNATFINTEDTYYAINRVALNPVYKGSDDFTLSHVNILYNQDYSPMIQSSPNMRTLHDIPYLYNMYIRLSNEKVVNINLLLGDNKYIYNLQKSMILEKVLMHVSSNTRSPVYIDMQYVDIASIVKTNISHIYIKYRDSDNILLMGKQCEKYGIKTNSKYVTFSLNSTGYKISFISENEDIDVECVAAFIDRKCEVPTMDPHGALFVFGIDKCIPDKYFLRSEKITEEIFPTLDIMENIIRVYMPVVSYTITYTPEYAGPDKYVEFNSPYGTLTRVSGIPDNIPMKEINKYLVSTLMNISPQYRKMSMIRKKQSLRNKSEVMGISRQLQKTNIYILDTNTWNMHLINDQRNISEFTPNEKRVPGIVLITYIHDNKQVYEIVFSGKDPYKIYW